MYIPRVVLCKLNTSAACSAAHADMVYNAPSKLTSRHYELSKKCIHLHHQPVKQHTGCIHVITAHT